MPFPYRKILFPMDFDANSLRALDKAVEIAHHFQANMMVVHVVPMVLEFPDIPHSSDRYEEEEKTARTRLSEILRQRLHGIACESAIYLGDIVGGSA
jgi:nucleotide-binding universal stress UspA family protein